MGWGIRGRFRVTFTDFGKTLPEICEQIATSHRSMYPVESWGML